MYNKCNLFIYLGNPNYYLLSSYLVTTEILEQKVDLQMNCSTSQNFSLQSNHYKFYGIQLGRWHICTLPSHLKSVYTEILMIHESRI